MQLIDIRILITNSQNYSVLHDDTAQCLTSGGCDGMDVKTLDTHSPFSASLSIVSSLVSVRCSSNPATVKP